MTIFHYGLDRASYLSENCRWWGFGCEHLKRATGSWDQRIVHGLIGTIELIPIVGQIASLFERAIVCQFPLSSLSDRDFQWLSCDDLGEDQCTWLIDPKKGSDAAYRRFGLLFGSRVNQILSKMPLAYVKFISDQQLCKLEFNRLSQEQVGELFSTTPEEIERTKRRFALLKSEQVDLILAKLTFEQLDLISNEQLADLNLDQLSKEQLKRLLLGSAVPKLTSELLAEMRDELTAEEISRVNLVITEEMEEVKKRLSSLNREQARAVVRKMSLYMIDSQFIGALNLTGLSPLEVSGFLCRGSAQEVARRLKDLNCYQTQHLLPKLPAEYWDCIPIEPIQHMHPNFIYLYFSKKSRKAEECWAGIPLDRKRELIARAAKEPEDFRALLFNEGVRSQILPELKDSLLCSLLMACPDGECLPVLFQYRFPNLPEGMARLPYDLLREIVPYLL